MRPADIPLITELSEKLRLFHNTIPMPGIATPLSRDCLVKQIVDSIRRVKYVQVMGSKTHNESVCSPASSAFNPIKAAAWHRQAGNIDEAAWLLFLSIHFGQHGRTKWQLVKNVYGALGAQTPWTWDNIKENVDDFRNWLHLNETELKKNAKFGNHRKYESINAFRNNGTGEAIASYINWIIGSTDHAQLFADKIAACGGDKREAFAQLYNDMNCVARFGRTARFDYLTMIGKLGLVDIEPDKTYMKGATGPYRGATLLFGGPQPQATFELWLAGLEELLRLDFGMQVLEDALCNWQKSPNMYKHFSG